jgi:diguanylate cyclase (GGDEF)-like protein
MQETLKNLVQKLRISDAELRERKELLGLTRERETRLERLRTTCQLKVDDLVGRFYAQQLAIPEIRSIIGDFDTFARLKGAMRGYVLRMFDGTYDLNYANSRLRVGQVHARIGVPPRLYVASLHLLEELIAEMVLSDSDAEDVAAVRKLFLLDLQFAFDAYIDGLLSKVELAHDAVHHYARSLEAIIEERTEDARRAADTDPLSGLANRRSFQATLHREWDIARVSASDVSIALLDIDDFKQINDRFGHARGDMVIQTVGAAIRVGLRDTDRAFRYGGDEFLIVMPATMLAEARRMIAGIQATCRNQSMGASISAGVASSSEVQEDAPALLALADQRLYEAKAGGPRVTDDAATLQQVAQIASRRQSGA